MDLFTLLRGTWRFHRRLHHASGEALEAMGTATWSPSPASPATLAYEELGVLRSTRGAPIADVRQLHTYHQQPPPPGAAHGPIHVHFSDGRFFHALDLPPPLLPGARAAFAHDCAPDAYAGTFALAAPLPSESGALALEVEWRVLGPAKSYTSTTRCWRAVE